MRKERSENFAEPTEVNEEGTIGKNTEPVEVGKDKVIHLPAVRTVQTRKQRQDSKFRTLPHCLIAFDIAYTKWVVRTKPPSAPRVPLANISTNPRTTRSLDDAATPPATRIRITLGVNPPKAACGDDTGNVVGADLTHEAELEAVGGMPETVQLVYGSPLSKQELLMMPSDWRTFGSLWGVYTDRSGSPGACSLPLQLLLIMKLSEDGEHACRFYLQ